MKQQEKSPGGPTKSPTYTKKTRGGDMFPLLSEDNEGLALGPKTVVILGLLFMGVVVLLHIISKIKS
jgi:hypothetical protein